MGNAKDRELAVLLFDLKETLPEYATGPEYAIRPDTGPTAEKIKSLCSCSITGP